MLGISSLGNSVVENRIPRKKRNSKSTLLSNFFTRLGYEKSLKRIQRLDLLSLTTKCRRNLPADIPVYVVLLTRRQWCEW